MHYFGNQEMEVVEKKKPPDGGFIFLYAIKGISVPLCF